MVARKFSDCGGVVMDIVHTIFKRKKINFSKLIPFGFIQEGNTYTYEKILPENEFILTVKIAEDGSLSTEIIDSTVDEPYTLHLAEGAVGSFVGKVKMQYEETLAEIAEKCFEPDVFKSSQAKELIEYVRQKYVNELEFLWEKFPDNAVWRRTDNEKWYGVILTVSKSKLGIKADETVEIIDLRIQPEKMAELIDNENYFPGWHMNKKNWYTIILDGSVSMEELCRRIDESYRLAKK